MGGQQSSEYGGGIRDSGSGNIRIGEEQKSEGMFGRFMKFGFGSGQTNNNHNQGPADMTVTGEGCQPLSDSSWKRRENKFQGNSSLSDKEIKERRELDQKSFTEKYIAKYPKNENYLGFENDSNICYANSATQVLYHCKPFRHQVLQWKPSNPQKYYLINDLQDLFKSMQNAKGTRGIMNHRRFISRVRAGKAEFNNDDHHDSHEYITWLIDEIHMNICEDYRHFVRKRITSKEYQKELQNKAKGKQEIPNYSIKTKEQLEQIIKEKLMPNFKTWVQLMFQGQFVSITKCQTCEQTSLREEEFNTLSIDIESNVSLSNCLKKFSTKELLNLNDKFFCESCNSKQVATRQMMIKKRPKLLLTHLKRFKMNYQNNTHSKLTHRIPFPQQLNIEDNQIYHGPQKNDNEEDKNKEFNDNEDAYQDLSIENQLLKSESHFGTQQLQKLTEIDKMSNTDNQSRFSYFQSQEGIGNKQDVLNGYNYCYDLSGIVIHYGSGMHYGHYWSLSKSNGPIGSSSQNKKWIEFDDTKTRVLEDMDVSQYFGAPTEVQNNQVWGCAYMLLYESQDLKMTEEPLQS